MKRVIGYTHSVDWLVKDILKGKIGYKTFLCTLLAALGFIVASYLGGKSEFSSRELGGVLYFFKYFSWVLLYPVFVYLVRKRLGFFSLASFFIAALYFFYRYFVFLILCNLVMFAIVLTLGYLFQFQNQDFRLVNVVLRYIAGMYFYSQVFYLLLSLKKETEMSENLERVRLSGSLRSKSGKI